MTTTQININAMLTRLTNLIDQREFIEASGNLDLLENNLKEEDQCMRFLKALGWNPLQSL